MSAGRSRSLLMGFVGWGKRSYSRYEPSCPRYVNSYKYDKYMLGCVGEGSHLWETRGPPCTNTGLRRDNQDVIQTSDSAESRISYTSWDGFICLLQATGVSQHHRWGFSLGPDLESLPLLPVSPVSPSHRLKTHTSC